MATTSCTANEFYDLAQTSRWRSAEIQNLAVGSHAQSGLAVWGKALRGGAKSIFEDTAEMRLRNELQFGGRRFARITLSNRFSAPICISIRATTVIRCTVEVLFKKPLQLSLRKRAE